MKTIEHFILKELHKISSVPLTAEGLHLLLQNVAKNCSDYFVTQALEEASTKVSLSYRDSILNAYPLEKIK